MRQLAISIIILILGLLGLLNPFRDGIQKFAAPIQFGLRRSAINFKDSTNLFYNLDKIRQDNIKLLQENQKLRGLIIELKTLEEQNTILKKQLGLSDNDLSFGKKLLAATVMGNPQDITNTSLVLDKGTAHGVTVGANIILEGFLIGQVTVVTKYTCMAELLTSPNFSATVKDLETGTEGIATGNLGTSIVVSKILAGEQVSVGDSFITSGKDGYFLPGYSIGTVTQVTQESAQPVKSAILEPSVFINKLTKVFILVDTSQ